ncbi:MAG TPA: GNAT family N-acetyltransferase [Ktedonobacteraceae bacterium]|jgi:predicted N-acyltransferase|nr:GNAT family N-acetyltransferase [Ktedonobacteraceae bacterium]
MEVRHISDKVAASSTLRVIDIDPQTDARWEELMRNTPASWVYYAPAWLGVLQEVYGYKPAHLACEDETSRLVAILPLFYQHGWRSGRIIKSAFTGPLTSSDAPHLALLQAAVARTRTRSLVKLHLKLPSNALDGLVEGMVGRLAYSTYMLALPEQAGSLRLDPTIKRAINKAIRSGVEVREAETEAELRAWYELYLQTMRKFAALPNPYRYYRVAWQRLRSKGMLRLLLAEHVEAGHRRLIAGFLYLLWGATISYACAGWREEEQALRPNDLLHWRAMQDACAAGIRWYDFGDVEPGNNGLARYKAKWGAVPTPVYDYSYPPAPQDASDMPALVSDRAPQLMQLAWRYFSARTVGALSDWYYAMHLY